MAKRKTKRFWAIVLGCSECNYPPKLLGPYKTRVGAKAVVKLCNWSDFASVVPIDVPQRDEKSRLRCPRKRRQRTNKGSVTWKVKTTTVLAP